ncbi:8823_t:CDS:1, partial [Scutellospora calospora]
MLLGQKHEQRHKSLLALTVTSPSLNSALSWSTFYIDFNSLDL